MASFILKRALFANSSVFKTNALIYAGIRNHSHAHYRPGPQPENEKDCEKAAKKYDLFPDEYKPFHPDECLGNYPNFPPVSGEAKDPYYPWDNPELKRNFNEPMHPLFNIIGEDRYDISLRPRYPVWDMALWFFGTIGMFYTVYFIMENYKFGRPVTAKQYPGDGPHYTFDPK